MSQLLDGSWVPQMRMFEAALLTSKVEWWSRMLLMMMRWRLWGERRTPKPQKKMTMKMKKKKVAAPSLKVGQKKKKK